MFLRGILESEFSPLKQTESVLRKDGHKLMRAKVGDKRANFNLVGRGGGTGVTSLAKCESSQENEMKFFIQLFRTWKNISLH